MNISRYFIRMCLLFDFRSGLKATETERSINDVFCHGIESEIRFRDSDFNIDDSLPYGWPSSVTEELFKVTTASNPHRLKR